MIRFIDFGNHISIIAKNNLLKDGLNLAFEGDNTSYSQFKSISESFPKINWESTSMLMENLQAVKDESELNAIRAAVEITDVIYEEILPMLRPGTTEKEVANQLVLRYRQESDGEAYNPIVAGGENGALPHAVPSDRPFQNGDFIVIDAAAKYAGYHADMTRTPLIGKPTDKHSEFYAIPTYFVPVRHTGTLNLKIEAVNEIKNILPNKIGIVTTAQHLHLIEEAGKILGKQGFDTSVTTGGPRLAGQGQLLGCNSSAARRLRVDGFLYILACVVLYF